MFESGLESQRKTGSSDFEGKKTRVKNSNLRRKAGKFESGLESQKETGKLQILKERRLELKTQIFEGKGKLGKFESRRLELKLKSQRRSREFESETRILKGELMRRFL